MNCALARCPPLAHFGPACHCGACHQTFGTLTAFDAHQDWAGWVVLTCRQAQSLGLVADHNGTWQTPQGLADHARRAARLSERRR